MYACLFSCTNFCVYECMYVYMYACMRVCVYSLIYLFIPSFIDLFINLIIYSSYVFTYFVPRELNLECGIELTLFNFQLTGHKHLRGFLTSLVLKDIGSWSVHM